MVVVAYAAIYLIWGSTYLAISLAVHSIPPLLMMGLRCSAAGALLLLWALIRREPAALRHWGHNAYVNPLVAMGLGAGLAGEQLSPSVLSAGAVIAAGVAITLAGRSQLSHGAHADA